LKDVALRAEHVAVGAPEVEAENGRPEVRVGFRG
jgi:hypothetical protein